MAGQRCHLNNVLKFTPVITDMVGIESELLNLADSIFRTAIQYVDPSTFEG